MTVLKRSRDNPWSFLIIRDFGYNREIFMIVSMSKKAFTLVELMIVIAIIGILAAALFPSMTSYLARGRDTARIADIKKIQWALDMYFIDMGKYPSSDGHGFTNVEPNASWVNSSHSGSWKYLHNQIRTYLPKIPVDPDNTQWPWNVQRYGTSGPLWWSKYFVYSYFSTAPDTYCAGKSGYMLVYSLETMNPVDIIIPTEYCALYFDYRFGPDNRWLITTGKVQWK
jgi:type II secretion system protein G